MFQDWGFLIGEMWLLLILAALVGLVAGWLGRAIASWRSDREFKRLETRLGDKESQMAALESDILSVKSRYSDGIGVAQRKIEERDDTIRLLEERLTRIEGDHQKEVSALRASVRDRDGRILDLETELRAARDTDGEGSDTPTLGLASAAALSGLSAAATTALITRDDDAPDEEDDLRDAIAAAEADIDHRSHRVVPLPNSDAPVADAVGTKPQLLKRPRGSEADDLQQINGIGPKVESLCHMLGIFHIDQIAKWNEAELAWIDDNLGVYRGRASKDDWVGQARVLNGDVPGRVNLRRDRSE